MREISIAEVDIDTVAVEITKFASDLPSPEDLADSRSPAVKVNVSSEKDLWFQGL